MAKTETMFRDKAEKVKWCIHKEYQIPLISCLKCPRFPCRGITREDLQTLEESLFSERIFEGFKARRSRLFIFKYGDGVLKTAPAGFSLEKPDMVQLEGVEEVYVIAKTLVKQTRLVMKDKNEVANIRQKKNAQPK